MPLDRVIAEAKPLGDRCVAQPFGDEFEDLALPAAQNLKIRFFHDPRRGLQVLLGAHGEQPQWPVQATD